MPTITITNEQHDAIVGLLADLLDTAERGDFESRREYLGYVADLSDLFEAIKKED